MWQLLATYTTDKPGIIILGLIMTLLGMLLHIIKVVMKDQTKTFHDYIKDWRPFVLAIIGSLVGYIVLLQINEISALAFLGVGYASDNILNLATLKANSDLGGAAGGGTSSS